MIPKKVTLENFLSFGAKTELSFDDDEPLWVLGGPNGVGKSAIFDAITYCLFGSHRGGAKEIDPLIRHGADGFSVGYEFEFQGIDYRIIRNRSGKRTTQSVERIAAGKWERVPNINNVADVKDWVERTVGLGSDAFQASVLLRQGKADKIVEAKPAERLEILKKIIGAERYEELWGRVNVAKKLKSGELDRWKQKRALLTEVTPEQLADAELTVREAEAAKEAAELDVSSAIERLDDAKRWAEWEPKRKALAEKLTAAKEREADAGAIRKQYARLKDLNTVLPTLRQWLPLRATVEQAKPKLDELERKSIEAAAKSESLAAQLKRAAEDAKVHGDAAAIHEREANALRGVIDQKKKFLKSAEEVAKLGDELRAYSESLDGDLQSTNERHLNATTAQRNADNEKSAIAGLLDAANKHRRKIEKLETGVPCSACGQEVTAEHAAKEQAAAIDAVKELGAQLATAEVILAECTAALGAAEKSLTALKKQVNSRDQLRTRLADKTRDLESLGGTADAAKLKDELAKLNASADQHDRDKSDAVSKRDAAQADEKRLTPECQKAVKDANISAKAHTDAKATFESNVMKCDLLRDQLPEIWRAVENIAAFESEAKALIADRVAERFEQLRQDETLRDEWRQQLADCEGQLASVPEPSRIPVAEAETSHTKAKIKLESATDGWQTARDTLKERQKRAEEFAEVCRNVAEAETAARVHSRLDELLGKSHLQRELVRSAEKEIVRLADDTVRQLSDGDLSMELDANVKNDNEALAIAVRRAESANAIPVEYLSGSQKFRVAISIALAMGRFAAGQARPLESVIIDEGFGSLDKDGLRAAADELNRLKRHLRRIILVSHQEDFVSSFPVGWKLAPGEHGTTAEKFRRQG